MTIHLSIILFLPLATGVLGAFLPRELARWAVFAGTLAVRAYAIVLLIDFEPGGEREEQDDGQVDRHELEIRK